MNEKLIVVLPIYNEKDCLQLFIEEWVRVLKTYPFKFSIYAIDDGSTDHSAQIIKNLQAQYPEIVLYSKTNEGHGKAVMFGYHQAVRAGADWIFQVDSDFQFLPEDFDKLWQNRHESPFILGYRENREDSVARKFISWILRVLAVMLFKVEVKDINIPFRLMRSDWLKALINEVPASSLTPNIQLAVLADSIGAQPFNIPVHHKERQGGTPSLNVKNLYSICCHSMIDLILLRFLISSKRKRLETILPKYNHEKS